MWSYKTKKRVWYMLLFRRIKELVVITTRTCTCTVYRQHQPLCKNGWCLYEHVLPSHHRTIVSYLYGTLSQVLYPVETNNYYYTFYSLSIISLAKSLQLILEISATYMYRVVSYLLADNWVVCRLQARCIISSLEQCRNFIGSMQQCNYHYLFQNNV